MKKKLSLLLVMLVSLSLLLACGGEKQEKSQEKDESGEIQMDIEDVHKKVKEEFGEDYLPDKSLSLEELSELTGIEEDSVEEYIGEISTKDAYVDTFIAIEAKKDDAYDVAQTLLRYQEYLNEEILNYPMNIAKIKTSKVDRKGDYVFFVMLGAPKEFEDEESEEAMEFYHREVSRVQVIINKACG